MIGSVVVNENRRAFSTLAAFGERGWLQYRSISDLCQPVESCGSQKTARFIGLSAVGGIRPGVYAGLAIGVLRNLSARFTGLQLLAGAA